MSEKQTKAMLNEIKNMNVKQLEQAKKDIEDIIKRIDKIIGEKKND